MSRLQLKVALDRRGGIRCRDCGKRLNRRTVSYREFTYPMGNLELVPVCKGGCKP